MLTVPSLEAPTLPLRDRDVAVGNPLDLEGTFSEGIVSGKRKLDGARLLRIHGTDLPWKQRRPRARRPSARRRRGDSSLRAGQNLNFAISADYLSQMMHNLGGLRELARSPAPRAKSPCRDRAEGFFRHLRRLLHLR